MYQLKEIRLSYKLSKNRKPIGTIDSSQTAFDILYNSWDLNEIALLETFKVIYLDNSNNVKGIVEHSRGGVTGTLVDIRIIMAAALKSLSVSILLAHNHPSGEVRPSLADKTLTNKIIKAAKYFDISVLDHIIISPEREYFSFRDNDFINTGNE